ncbi:MAG: type II toxin-antitoxin system RelE/ParE family toxin [Devosia sp.]
MTLRVVLARTAQNDLKKIGRWISEAGAPRTGQRYVARIKQRLAKLGDAPEVGRPYGYNDPGLRIIGYERRIMIAYRVEKTRIIVARVFYGDRTGKRYCRPVRQDPLTKPASVARAASCPPTA